MSKIFEELENKLSDDWKFVIKNALLLVVSMLLIYIIFMVIAAVIQNLFYFSPLEPLISLLLFVLYFGGLFTFFLVIFRIILNFMYYFREK